jgi:hypothetical protein
MKTNGTNGRAVWTFERGLNDDHHTHSDPFFMRVVSARGRIAARCGTADRTRMDMVTIFLMMVTITLMAAA